jgi:hypothetical protein
MGCFMVRLLAGTAVAAILMAGSAQAANLVTNGSFEDGLNGWTIGGADNQVPPFPPAAIFYNNSGPYPDGAFGEAVTPDNSISASPDAVGDRAAYFVSDLAVNQSLSQQIFLLAGTYKIGFSAYAPANGFGNAGDASFSGSIAGVELANYLVSSGPVTTWQAFSGQTMVGTAGMFDIEFIFNTSSVPSKDVVIDRVFVTRVGGVPEPSSWAMLIAGFGLVGAARRGRRGLTVAA